MHIIEKYDYNAFFVGNEYILFFNITFYMKMFFFIIRNLLIQWVLNHSFIYLIIPLVIHSDLLCLN